jgi:hypothetical protein
MMGVASRAVGGEAGRGLLTLANLITAAAPLAADWNDSHIVNRRWPSHARFHGVVALLVRGTGVDDPPHPVPRVAGVPTSLLGATATTLTAVAGCWSW